MIEDSELFLFFVFYFLFCFVLLGWSVSSMGSLCNVYLRLSAWVSALWEPRQEEERAEEGACRAWLDSLILVWHLTPALGHTSIHNTRASRGHCLQKINFLFFAVVREVQPLCLQHGGGLRFELLFMLLINRPILPSPRPQQPAL